MESSEDTSSLDIAEKAAESLMKPILETCISVRKVYASIKELKEELEKKPRSQKDPSLKEIFGERKLQKHIDTYKTERENMIERLNVLVERKEQVEVQIQTKDYDGLSQKQLPLIKDLLRTKYQIGIAPKPSDNRSCSNEYKPPVPVKMPNGVTRPEASFRSRIKPPTPFRGFPPAASVQNSSVQKSEPRLLNGLQTANPVNRSFPISESPVERSFVLSAPSPSPFRMGALPTSLQSQFRPNSSFCTSTPQRSAGKPRVHFEPLNGAQSSSGSQACFFVGPSPQLNSGMKLNRCASDLSSFSSFRPQSSLRATNFPASNSKLLNRELLARKAVPEPPKDLFEQLADIDNQLKKVQEKK